MHTCTHVFTSPLLYLKFQSWYIVEIYSTDDLYETMTIDDVKIENYLMLKMAFSSCMFALKL